MRPAPWRCGVASLSPGAESQRDDRRLSGLASLLGAAPKYIDVVRWPAEAQEVAAGAACPLREIAHNDTDLLHALGADLPAGREQIDVTAPAFV